MEIPDRIAERLDGETIQSAVNLGDEDLICFTPTRSILYRGEGLLSDESVKIFSHDVERLSVSEGRRKTKFTLEYVDNVKEFTVTSKRGDQVLQRLLAGILTAADVLDEEESVAGVYLFSELTLVITDSRLVKHVGSYVWDPDFEVFPYSDVTKLDFEEGSHATQIVISVAGRPQRIKAPTDKAKKLRQALSHSLFAYHEVDSLDELNELIGQSDAAAGDAGESSSSGGLDLDDSISPLVGGSEDSAPEDDAADSDTSPDPLATDSIAEDDSESGGDDSAGADEKNNSLISGSGTAETDDQTDKTENESDDASERTVETEADISGRGSQIDPAEIEEMKDQIAILTEAVEQQNEQIEAQQETIEQLIEELRRHT